MNSKAICGIIFVLVCTLQLGYAIKCYRCDSESSCRKAKKYDCNQVYANETMRFLDAYYTNANTNNLTLSSFLCMRQDMKFTSTGVVKFKGCIYSNVNSCGLTLRQYYQTALSTHSCVQCINKDGCNPADRSSVSIAAVVLPLLVVLIYKQFV